MQINQTVELKRDIDTLRNKFKKGTLFTVINTKITNKGLELSLLEKGTNRKLICLDTKVERVFL